MPKIRNKKLIVVPTTLFVLITGFIAFYFLAIPKIINIDKYRGVIAESIDKDIKAPVTFGRLDTEMTWGLGVKLKTTSLGIKDVTDKDLLYAGPASIEISLPSLLRKKIVIREIIMDNPRVTIIRRQSGRYNIEDLIPTPKKEPPKYKVLLKDTNIKLNNYQITFIDRYTSPTQQYTVVGQNIWVSDLDPKKFVKVTAKGAILSGKKHNTFFDFVFSTKLPFKGKSIASRDILLKGEVRNLYPSMYLTYISKFTPYKYSSITGAADLKFDVSSAGLLNNKNQFLLDAALKDVYAKLNGKTVLSFPNTSKIHVAGRVDKNNLVFDKSTLNSKNIKGSFQGVISDYRKKSRKIDLKIGVLESSVNDIAQIFPKQIKIPHDPIEKLLKYNVDATAWANLRIVGVAKKPDLIGHVRFKDFSMLFDSKEIPKGSGTLDFLGEEFRLDVKAFVGKDDYVKAKGAINPFKGKSLNLDVLSNVIDLGNAQEYLLALSDIIGFKLGPVPLMDIDGTGKVNLNIKGPFKTANLFGKLSVNNGYATYEGLSKPARNANGVLLFKGDRIDFNGIYGYIEGSKVIAEGYSTLKGFSDVKLTMPNMNLDTGEELIYNSPLLDEVQVALAEVEDITGFASAVINLTGTEETLLSTGTLDFNNAGVTLVGYSKSFTSVDGTLRYNDEDVFFEQLTGRMADSPATVSGSILGGENLNLTLTSPRLNLSQARELIVSSPALEQVQRSLRDFTSFSGFANTKLVLAGNVDSQDLLQQLTLRIGQAGFVHNQVGYPVTLRNGTVLITSSKILTGGIGAQILDVKGRLSGQVTGLEQVARCPSVNGRASNACIANSLKPNLKLVTEKFNFNTLDKLARIPLAPAEARQALEPLRDLNGQIAVNADIRPATFNLKTSFYDASAVYSPTEAPVLISSGNLTVNPTNIFLDQLYARFSKTDGYFDGVVRNYSGEPRLNLFASIEANSDDIEKYIIPLLDEPLEVKGTIPLAAVLNGTLDDWDVNAQLTLGKGDKLIYRDIGNLPENEIRVLSLNASGNQNSIDIRNLEIATNHNPILVGQSASPVLGMATTLNKLLFASGGISNLQTDNPRFDNLVLNIPEPVNVALLNPAIKTPEGEEFFQRGNLTGRLSLNGLLSSPDLSGNIYLRDVSIPSQNILISDANLAFADQNIILQDSNLNIAGSQMRVSAVVSNYFDFPLFIKEIRIASPSINVDEVVQSFTANKEPDNQGMPQVVIGEGTLLANELIISNLITENLSTNFTFTPDWLLSMDNLSFKTAGGNVYGQLLYNIKTTDLSGTLAAKDMKANAAATTLLSIPNEVYGDLNGKVQFTTRGKTAEELIANADGVARFEIRDGRLVRLGSLEYLLRAVNVLQGGVAGLNINNIIDLIIPQKTGSFDVLEGTVYAKNGILRSDNLESKGKNLNLNLSGSLDMATNFADITILGRVSRKVAGLLGPLGSLSINTFIDFIPGLGFLPSEPESGGILSRIPLLSRIPGLGLGGDRKFRRFIVEIEGDLYEPTSVKSFRWLE